MSLFSRSKSVSAAFAAMSVVLGSSAFSPAAAATFALTPFTGSDAEVSISLDDLGDGNIGVNVEVNSSVALADLRGVFFTVANEAILPELKVINASPDIQDFAFGVSSVIGVGSGRNKAELKGEPALNPCLADGRRGCDGGLLIGTNGIGKDDVRSVSWTFTREDRTPLTLADFEGMAWGVRATSVGPEGSRGGSTKLSGLVSTLTAGPDPKEAPEPTTAMALLSVSAGAFVLKRKLI